MQTSRMPIARVPAASHRPFPVTSVIETPTRAKIRPIRAPRSSRSTTGNSGAFARRTNCTQFALPRMWFDSLIAVRNENPSRPIATTSTVIGSHCQLSNPCGSLHLW